MLFWNSKPKENKNDALDTLRRDVDKLQSDISLIRREMLSLDSDIALLRGQFNRKLKGLSAEVPQVHVKEEEKVGPKEEEKPKPLNSGGAVVFTGMHGLDFPK